MFKLVSFVLRLLKLKSDNSLRDKKQKHSKVLQNICHYGKGDLSNIESYKFALNKHSRNSE
jgi:hypothetical protein